MINELRDYFLRCPFLEESAKMGIDYLTDGAVNYSINSEPTTPILKKYTDGSALKAFNFTFQSHEYYSAAEVDNIENLEFYSKLEKWIKENNQKNILPELKESYIYPQIVEVLTGGYLFDNDEATGRYVIQLRLIYMEE